MAKRWRRTRECGCGQCRFRSPLMRCPMLIPDENGETPAEPVQLWAQYDDDAEDDQPCR